MYQIAPTSAAARRERAPAILSGRMRASMAPNDQVEGRAATDARKEESPRRRVPSNAWLALLGFAKGTGRNFGRQLEVIAFTLIPMFEQRINLRTKVDTRFFKCRKSLEKVASRDISAQSEVLIDYTPVN